MKSAQNVTPRYSYRLPAATCSALVLPMHFDWDPVIPARTVKIPPGALRMTVPSLCRRAGIPVLATVDRPVYVYRGRKKVKTPAFDLVGVPVSPRSREGALRALEKLAYSFFDHCARYCVCERGYFTASETKPRRYIARNGNAHASR